MEGSWSLIAVNENGKAVTRALLANGDQCRIDVLPAGLPPIEIVKRWPEFSAALQRWDAAAADRLEPAALLPPLQFPNKVICVGANYGDHRSEMATAADEGRPREPFFFLKPPTTTIIGPGDAIVIRGDSDRVDWEAEVGLVIGRTGRFIDEADALEHVAGYTLVNDVSARGCHLRDDPMNAAFAYDWLSSKGQDTFCPTGPGIVPSWFVPDPDNIPFSLTINGVTEQSGSTANLIAGLRRLIASLSRIMTLEAGDLIATGTPGGVGVAKGRFLSRGDIVALASPLLGTFANVIEVVGQ